MPAPIEIIDKTKCCGCGACYAACPKDCIALSFDEEGFLYPHVNVDTCIECGKCVAVCPLIEENVQINARPVRLAYAAANKDNTVRANSSSGGIFGAIAKAVITEGGVVAGAGFDADMEICHWITDNIEGLSPLYGSKYVQSDLTRNDIYRTIKTILNEGRVVLFSGTPCQVQGLRVFLGKDYSNLLTIDFICHAVPSPRFWNDYLRYMENKYDSKIVSASFRSKTYGYHSSAMRLSFENGKTYYGSARVDYMLKTFFSNLASRPSCYHCAFRRLERCSDFTLFDCWSYSELTGNTDDNLGYTHLWIHSKKGEEFIPKIKPSIELWETDMSLALARDGVMATRDITYSTNRMAFIACYQEFGIKTAIDRYIPISKMDYLIEKSKRILSKMGILQMLSKIKRNHR